MSQQVELSVLAREETLVKTNTALSAVSLHNSLLQPRQLIMKGQPEQTTTAAAVEL